MPVGNADQMKTSMACCASTFLKKPLSTVTTDEIKMIQDIINHRPRKRIGFKTPHKVFHQSLNRVAIRAWV